MMRLIKRQREDTFQTGKENSFRKLFRNWLSADGFGICRIRCTDKNPKPVDLAQDQATESVKDVHRPKSDSIAQNSPGDIDLYLLLKKRSEKSLSDKTAENDSALPVSEPSSGKAVQE